MPVTVIVVLFIFVISLSGLITHSYKHPISAKKSLVYGIGLDARIVLPARYFFIQAVDDYGKNFTSSPGEGAFNISIYSTRERCRIWVQTLDKQDGSLIVRYRLFQSCDSLQITVTIGAEHVAQSPYLLKGIIYHEECPCPLTNLQEWFKVMNCPATYEQIEKDLSIFTRIDMEKVAHEAILRFNQSGYHSICHYSVLGNKIYRRCYGEHVGFKIFVDNLFLSLSRKVILPDFEFIINLGDWPLEKHTEDQNPIPIISWCGSEDSRDIILPTYDITESTLETMGRVMLDMLSVQGNTGPAWENKIEKGFWRGRDSRQERLDLVKLSREHPDLLDAALTNFFFFIDKMDEYGPKVKHRSFFDFFKYKYQISLDGTVAAYRFPYLLAGNSVVFKQDSDYYEHFYKQLQPMVHYIPFKRNLSDLVEKIKWAREHDEEVKKIAENGRLFAQENLLASNIICYHVILFHKYSQTLISPVNIHEGMESVEEEIKEEPHCTCQRTKYPKEEL